MKNLTKLFAFGLLTSMSLGYGCSPKWTETDKGTFKLISNEGGQTLGYSPTSGVQLLTVDRFAFKDLNKNGKIGRAHV